nr:immunoglobulin light chain junction region [Macaca mulatta]MOV81283.1 immunoglobulin light chain junction region [Macaca mulatta]
CQQYSSDPYNF